jgi:hypothetical protein
MTNAPEEAIYQVQQYDNDAEFENTPEAIPQVLDLDLRGTHVKLDRDTLVSLPESLLIAMFPNGLVLGRPDYDSESEDSEGQDSVGEPDVFTTQVDFDAACLDYVLSFYRKAQQVRQTSSESIFASSPAAQYYPSLIDKQPIIVLREELEYYCVPSSKDNDLLKLKTASGQHLLEENLVFAALQKNIEGENNIAEQHLIDMLCDAGFTREDVWEYRELEPHKTCIVSMKLVLLNTMGQESHMATAQKLLLFWRKPAVSISYKMEIYHI